MEPAKEEVERQSPASMEEPSGPSATEPSDVDMDTSSPAPELEPAEATPEITQPPQRKPDSLSESWLFDSQILRPGVVVNLRQDSLQDRAYGEYAGAHRVIESIDNLPGRLPTVLFRHIDGNVQANGIPITMMVPVQPSEEGETVIILSGKHKGKVGKVIRFEEDMVSVDLNGSEIRAVDFEPSLLCLFSQEDRAPVPDPVPPPSRVPQEKGDSMSSPPAPQSEDGEIVQDPFPRSQPQQNSSFPQATTPLRAAPINAPTQPRSFQNLWKNNPSIIPSRPNSLSHLMNANPNGGVNNNSGNLGGVFANSPNRPSPPSGPKALRGLNPRTSFEGSRFKTGVVGSGLNGNGTSGLPGINGNGMGVGLKRESNPNNGHPAIPRGPLADRERDRERTNGNWSTKNWGGGWR